MQKSLARSTFCQLIGINDFFLLLASESKHHYQYRSIQTEYTSQDVDTQSRLKWWLKNSINIRDADMIAVTQNLSSCEIKG